MVNKPLIKPYFWGGGVRGLGGAPVDDRHNKNQVGPEFTDIIPICSMGLEKITNPCTINLCHSCRQFFHSSPIRRIWDWKMAKRVVSTHFKNISQNVNLPQVGVKIKHIWNHHLVFRGEKKHWVWKGKNVGASRREHQRPPPTVGLTQPSWTLR